MVICDEAHRTAGGHFTDEKEAVFTRIHNNDYVAAKKRLYMTATPKIYGSDAKKQNEDGDIVPVSYTHLVPAFTTKTEPCIGLRVSDASSAVKPTDALPITFKTPVKLETSPVM